MTDEERETIERATTETCRDFMRRMGEKYPWLHPDFDPESALWRRRAVEAWNAQGRKPYLY